ERTIEDTKKIILEADITETKFSQDEDKMIYFFLLSSLRKDVIRKTKCSAFSKRNVQKDKTKRPLRLLFGS
ncbi:hypothetical protein, partial [uncultured Duncaniella sp.]